MESLILKCIRLVFFLAMFIAPSVILASDSARVTLMETYGTSTEKEGGKYRVATFIPRTFLLFDVDEDEPDLKVGEKYLAATTQDGVRVFILESAVSKGSYETVFGDQDIIFNKSHSVCQAIQCNQDDEDQLLPINAGEVFRSEKLELDGSIFYKLVGNRGNRNAMDEVTGYIGQDELQKLNRKSIVTYASLEHPRYKVEETEALAINTSCGEVIHKDSVKLVQTISDTDRRIMQAFKLAEEGNNNQLQYKIDSGGEGKQISYKLFNVIDRRSAEDHENHHYAVQIVYRCDESNVFKPNTSIESVALINLDNDDRQIFDSFGTPADLLQFTGAPYLYSVNSERQYFQLMDKLSDKLESRALAGYFLAKFNRSCRSTVRKKQKLCQHKAYE